jgi:hypothetical protein
MNLGEKIFIALIALDSNMHKASDLVTNAQFQTHRDNKELEKDLDPLTITVVNRLFNFFEAICPGFDKQFKDSPIKLKAQKINFARGFMDEGINRIEQIEVGIKKCRRKSPVNIPLLGDFLDWCKPNEEDLGFIPKEQAFHKAIEFLREGNILSFDENQIAILKHTISETGSFDLRNIAEYKMRPIFERNYEIAIKDFINGKLKPIPKGLPDKSIETLELKKQETIKKNFSHIKNYTDSMTEIKKILGVKKWSY